MQYNETGRKAFPRPANAADFVQTGIRVKVSSAGVVSAAGATDADLGTIDRPMHEREKLINVCIAGSGPGTVMVVANGPIPLGAVTYCADDGKVGSSGSLPRGRCLQAATADGDLIEISNYHPPLS